jgi:peptidyl-prolyl cis-trans isomerase SurA
MTSRHTPATATGRDTWRAFLRVLRCACFWLCAATLPAAAQQGPFDIVARVDESVITRFEVTQRARFFGVLRRPDATADGALQSLIEDRLKIQAARDAGIVPTTDDIRFGIDEFAARANLTGEELLIAVSDVGIEPETVRDYIGTLLAWGEVVRERFTARARPSAAEVERAAALGLDSGATRVLLSEIILPLGPDVAAATQERAAAIAELRSFDAFSAAARRFSVAPSAADGGRLDWLALSDLPAQLAPILLGLQPGDVTAPIPLDGGLGLFQLRGLEDRRPPLAGDVTLVYATIRLPQGADLEAERLRLQNVTDRCDDLFGVYQGAGEDRLVRETAPRSALPAALGSALDRLDTGEMAVFGPQSSTGGGRIVMLCDRSVDEEEDLSLEQIRQQLFARRLESLGAAYLAELRADAFIEILE